MNPPVTGDRLTRLLDRSAIGLSGLCLIHCLAFPVLIATLPALASILPRQWWVHPAILATALPLAGLAFYRGWHRHRDWRPVLFGVAGLSLLTVGVLAGENLLETLRTVAGGVVLATAHVLNWRLSGHGLQHDHGRRT